MKVRLKRRAYPKETFAQMHQDIYPFTEMDEVLYIIDSVQLATRVNLRNKMFRERSKFQNAT